MCLSPYEWIEIANENWRKLQEDDFVPKKSCKIGVDVAGMGRDDSVLCLDMAKLCPVSLKRTSLLEQQTTCTAGMITDILTRRVRKAFIDTIGEGGGSVISVAGTWVPKCILMQSSPRAPKWAA